MRISDLEQERSKLSRGPGGPGRPMKRISRSGALVPILIVIVLAFFAQKIISPSAERGQADLLGVHRADQHRRGRRRRSSRSTIKTNDNTHRRRRDRRDRVLDRLPGQHRGAAGQHARAAKTSRPRVEGKGGSSFLGLLTYILPFVLIFAFWIFLMNQMQGGGSRVMNFGKSRAKRMSVDAPKITFRDVAGADEAVQELHEIKEFLENPKKFQSLGARIPKGVLLYGPPGTGKTLLARAVAGEAGVPVLLDLRLGLRRDVRRRRRQPRPRPLRAGEAELPLHHLHGRDRRRRPPPRRRHGRRSRRARADAEPAPRRDGRLRDERQHHPDRGHQPARHPRPGAAPPGPLRPPDRRRPPRPQGPQEDPRGPHPRQAARRRASTSTRSPARPRASPAPTSRT